MKSLARSARTALTLVALLTFPLVGTLPAASAEASGHTRTWHLENGGDAQRMCVQQGSGSGVHRSYLIFAVTGEWSTNLDFGMGGLPPGWTATQSHIPPGSNYPDPDDGGVTVNGWISVGGPSSAPLGVYDAEIRVSDGTVTETARAEVVITTASWLDCMRARG
ncbi:DUF5980 family protein [Saccharothrix sp. HUAS TT1]|uniref:DUF5980 family protein n=1 Tax=unclassified Saccharothrix TaxID=2593673 RepID=UPI00345C025E